MAFAGKTVVFVGAAGGIGFETSKQLLSEGVEVITDNSFSFYNIHWNNFINTLRHFHRN